MQLTLKSVSKVFPGGAGGAPVTALEDIAFTVASGEFVAVLGPSGCGKSTLLEIIAGLSSPSAGEILLGDELVSSPSSHVSVVFQEDSTFPWRTVADNVGFGLQMRGVRKAEREHAVARAIELVGLSGFEGRYPHQLSGGMRQRVAIARTLVLNPAVMLMDEPFGALDEQTRFVIGEELLRIWDATGCTIFFVTHSLHEAVQLADRIVVLSARPGRVKRIFENHLPRPRVETEDPRAYAELMAGLRDAIGLTQAATRVKA
ncbi:ABC transporter ATP-binding protein [bacterium]|nr:MAG: ABC transporter ATP-binding protein [bacterium]